MSENIKQWNFNGNGYGPENGLDTSDMETFKKDPISSLAREVCQNSIDAKSGDGKVIVEFKSFEVEKNRIPSRERIEQEMRSCEEYKKSNVKIKNELNKMIQEISKEKITCLRISDFNTTGLIGVSENNGAFYSLTKGSGISDKVGTTGGSKGIGKYASFVASSFNTVFYSTITTKGETGYIGICKLCSTVIDGTDEKTQGTGYYGFDKKNSPILEKFVIDSSFNRTTPGTDIYILGFRNESTWKKEIVTKILDSFMSAIYKDYLEVIIDDIKLNSTTLAEVIKNEDLIINKLQNNIVSQYMLLNDEKVYREKISVGEYGEVELFLKSFGREEAHLATNECVMIRYPYMKIKTLPRIANIPCSAMCIIPNNKLNEILREIENPQHTDWEIKRITDISERQEVTAIYKELRDKIINFIQEKLSTSDNVEIDVEGASDYLPSVDTNDDFGASEEVVITEKPIIVKKIKNKVKDKIGLIENEEGTALQPEIGEHEEGDGSPVPEGQNKGSGGALRDSDLEEGNSGNPENEIMKLSALSGMQYRYFVVDRLRGKYVVSFTSLYDVDNCELEINYLDDSGNRYKTEINNCKINGEEAEVKEGKVVSFNLKNGSKYKFEYEANLNDLYACEVKVYANR